MKLNKTFLAVVAALGISSALYSSTVVAQPDEGRIITYYSDATMTEQVGEGGNGCHASYHWGQKTPYFTVETFNCS